jgi:hypothetical protein
MSTKRLVTAAIAFVAGAAALGLLLPLFSPMQPHGLSITRHEARTIADRAARNLGIEVAKAWVVVQWEPSLILDKELSTDRELRRRAIDDPVVGPRLGRYRVSYFRRGLEKYPTYGEVRVGRSGEVLSARRFARNETPGQKPPAESIRPLADAFVFNRNLPGVAEPVFDSVRPLVRNQRTDHLFVYRVRTGFPLDRLAFFVSVSFIGDQLAGWQIYEEYRDGTPFRYEMGQGIAGTFVRLASIYLFLLILMVIFLRKYHAGEVGVGTAGVLFALLVSVAILLYYLISAEYSSDMQMGGVDGRTTAIAMVSFTLLFFQLPLAVLVFLSWSVGESYAHERWGSRLAAFDSIVRRDPLNASAGRSTLQGLLYAPAVAAATLAPAAIVVLAGIASPTMFRQSRTLLMNGGPLTAILEAAMQAIFFPMVVLFILGFARAKRSLAAGVVVAVLAGSALGAADPPLSPETWVLLTGWGAAAAVVAIFFAADLLTAAVALFGGTLILGAVPLLLAAEGKARVAPMTALGVAGGVLLLYSIIAMASRRKVDYAYADLAPHVRKIIERERVKAEIDAANRIQAALLPSSEPAVGGIDVASHYAAATEIGGDYFDYLPLPDGKLAVAFGDVAGHGLTSGIVMAMAKSALLVQIGYDSSPRAVMNVLNDTVIRTAPKRMLMTFFFGVLDPVRRTLHFSSAGHLDPYVYRSATGALEALSSWGFPLGVRRRSPFEEIAVSFGEGDRLILYSDGLIEAIDDDDEPFGFDRFEAVLRDNASRSADGIRRAILSSVRRFTRNRPPEDDQTLVVLAFDAEAGEEAEGVA